jgi:hypothetical protein
VKELLAFIATTLVFVAYIPYIRDIKHKKTRPHPYTWFISGLITFIVFAIQITHGGGVGTIPTFFGASAGILVFSLSLGLGNKRPPITKSDTVFFLLAIAAIGVWLIANQPLFSAVLLSVIDVLAFMPTIRKSWKRPEQETISTYFVNSLRHAFSASAVQHYNLTAVAYPALSVIVDGLSGVYIFSRRKVLHK